jgi:hypothetical protein
VRYEAFLVFLITVVSALHVIREDIRLEKIKLGSTLGTEGGFPRNPNHLRDRLLAEGRQAAEGASWKSRDRSPS